MRTDCLSRVLEGALKSITCSLYADESISIPHRICASLRYHADELEELLKQRSEILYTESDFTTGKQCMHPDEHYVCGC